MLTRQPPPPDFQWASESIRGLRAHLGQSQAALARELGIRQQTVSEWETGMYKPRGASVTILTLLAVSSSFVFDDFPGAVSASQPSNGDVGQAPAPPARPTERTTYTADAPAPAVARAVTHPDWSRRPAAVPEALPPATRNRADKTYRRDSEIPM